MHFMFYQDKSKVNTNKQIYKFCLLYIPRYSFTLYMVPLNVTDLTVPRIVPTLDVTVTTSEIPSNKNPCVKAA